MLHVKEERKPQAAPKIVKEETLCYHCGTPCITDRIAIEDKVFCCECCKMVFEILNSNGLCDYYKIENHPGLSQVKPTRSDKFSYLENDEIANKLYTFTDGNRAIITLYLPGVHCSSCMWLIEHMHRLNENILESRLNFGAKEVTVTFLKEKISLRQVVELLTTIGYEPHISLDDGNKAKIKDPSSKARIYKLGVAGFCFGNIMMMSFPEYLGHSNGIEGQYSHLFRLLNLVLAIPVFFYSASEFYVSAWKGLKQKMLNIDAPIVLALIITFGRSIYEIASGKGGGYLDSMTGITFFMLVGRIVQERTYRSISFHRDYKAYFPIAVNVVTPNGVVSRSLQDLKEKDIVQLHNDEIIPADSIVIKGDAKIDYSFVTGESDPVSLKQGATIYAGGKQVGEEITIQIMKPVAGSYLTSLWNHHAFSKDKSAQNEEKSVIHLLSKYFTYILLCFAGVTATYWALHDPAKILPSVSAMLIVACPCALLLSASYTNGNLMRIFSTNGLYLRDATVIEQLGNVNHIVFDKTGTLTQGGKHFSTTGHQLSSGEQEILYTVVSSSQHPLSRALTGFLSGRKKVPLTYWKEYPGKGIDAVAEGNRILVGSASMVGLDIKSIDDKEKASLYVSLNGKITAFNLVPDFRDSIPQMIPNLAQEYPLSLLSGDNDKQRGIIQDIFGAKNQLMFNQRPLDKLNYIERLQKEGKKVMMVGDGLNDSGALQQSNVGVTLADDINNFTPSCDAILDAKRFDKIPALMKLARSGKFLIGSSFVVSILYNIVGLSISVQGLMSPMIAAILMPVSTLSIVLISTGASSVVAKSYGLTLKDS